MSYQRLHCFEPLNGLKQPMERSVCVNRPFGQYHFGLDSEALSGAFL